MRVEARSAKPFESSLRRRAEKKRTNVSDEWSFEDGLDVKVELVGHFRLLSV